MSSVKGGVRSVKNEERDREKEKKIEMIIMNHKKMGRTLIKQTKANVCIHI